MFRLFKAIFRLNLGGRIYIFPPRKLFKADIFRLNLGEYIYIYICVPPRKLFQAILKPNLGECIYIYIYIYLLGSFLKPS